MEPALEADAMAANHSAVAVVDDDAAVCDSIRFLLEMAGRKVDVYPSAPAFLKDLTGQPACLILDQQMPQMTGLELAARLRSKGIHVPVLLMTELLSVAITRSAAQFGIYEILEKPPDPDALLRFVAAKNRTQIGLMGQTAR